MGISGVTLLIFLFLVPVAIYLVFTNSKNSLYLLIATFPLFSVETLELGGGLLVLSPTKVIGAVVVVLMVVDLLSKGKEFRFLSPHMLFSILLLTLMLVSFMVNSARSLTWAQRYVSNLVFLLAMVSWVETREEADRTRATFITSLVFFSVLSLLGIVGEQEMGGSAEARFEATMLNANRAAHTYLVGVGLMFGWVLRNAESFWRRWVGFAVLGFFSYATLLTGSRAGLIGLVVAMAFAPILLWQQRSTRDLFLPLLAIMAGFIIFPPKIISERAKEIPTAEAGFAHEEARRTRVHQYRLAFDLINESPLLGVGPHEFIRIYSKRVEGDVVRVLHSWYLSVAVDAGLPALVTYVLLFLFSLFASLRTALGGGGRGLRLEAWAFILMVLGLMVFGTVSSVPYSKLNWLIFSWGAVEIRLLQKEREDEQMEVAAAFRAQVNRQSASSHTVVVVKKD